MRRQGPKSLGQFVADSRLESQPSGFRVQVFSARPHRLMYRKKNYFRQGGEGKSVRRSDIPAEI